MKKYRLLLLALSVTIAVISSHSILPTHAQAVSLPLDWPPAPLTSDQISAVKDCDLENIAKTRYPDALKADDLESAFTPVTACDWATLAFAHAERARNSETLPEAAKSAFSQAASHNLGFALTTPIFYRYFNTVQLVKAPPRTQQEIRDLEVTYRWAGSGNAAHFALKIQQANTTPTITVNPIPDMFDLMTNSKKMFDAARKTKLSKEQIQALVPTLHDLLPIQSQFTMHSCFDNYPNWEAKITYVDDTTLDLTNAGSNFILMGGPWFTNMKQQNYLQFSTAFAEALHALVTCLGLPIGQPIGMSCHRDRVFDQAFP
jgi:hypothetical protein